MIFIVQLGNIYLVKWGFKTKFFFKIPHILNWQNSKSNSPQLSNQLTKPKGLKPYSIEQIGESILLMYIHLGLCGSVLEPVTDFLVQTVLNFP